MSPLEACEKWLQEVVVNQNFCPYAAKPFSTGRISFVEIQLTSDEEVLLECHRILKSFAASSDQETVLIVLPKGFEDFMDFLDLAAGVELLLDEVFLNEFSLATFHPAHQFAEFEETDIVHHIHRSPYPILHILREESLDEVRHHTGDTSEITRRNHIKARHLGRAFFESFLPK